MAAQEQDKDRYLRAPLTVKVEVQEPDRVKTFKLRAIDVNSHGLFLITMRKILEGTKVRLCFSIPGAESKEVQLDIEGQVVSRRDGPSARRAHLEPGVGIEFVSKDFPHQDQLNDYIARTWVETRDER